jgi:hypothetical protein
MFVSSVPNWRVGDLAMIRPLGHRGRRRVSSRAGAARLDRVSVDVGWREVVITWAEREALLQHVERDIELAFARSARRDRCNSPTHNERNFLRL